jgi:hypothetical protein
MPSAPDVPRVPVRRLTQVPPHLDRAVNRFTRFGIGDAAVGEIEHVFQLVPPTRLSESPYASRAS